MVPFIKANYGYFNHGWINIVRHGYVKFNKFKSLWNSYLEKNLVLT